MHSYCGGMNHVLASTPLHISGPTSHRRKLRAMRFWLLVTALLLTGRPDGQNVSAEVSLCSHIFSTQHDNHVISTGWSMATMVAPRAMIRTSGSCVGTGRSQTLLDSSNRSTQRLGHSRLRILEDSDQWLAARWVCVALAPLAGGSDRGEIKSSAAGTLYMWPYTVWGFTD